MIRREQLRLGRAFRRLLLVSLAGPGALEACGSSPSAGPPEDAGVDSTMAGTDGEVDSSPGDDGATDAGQPDVLLDSAACQPSQPYSNDASFAVLPEAGPDAALGNCYYFVDFPCGTNYLTGTGPTACYLYLTECANICTLDGGFIDCLYWADAGCVDGSLTAQTGRPATIACGTCNGVGRRPAGLLGAEVQVATTPLGAYFAQASRLEAASVCAFERMHDELCTHKAPPELVRMARRSASDEVRHARVSAGLARRYGGQASAPRVRRQRSRSIEAFAKENAVEGCVRETFGAMVATWQAAHAGDECVKRSMRRIARDETRHAALAWAVARWADGQLDSAARRRIARARRAAVRQLQRDARVELPPSALRAAGLPSASEAYALIAALSKMWA
jgi:hypothetical protein